MGPGTSRWFDRDNEEKLEIPVSVQRKYMRTVSTLIGVPFLPDILDTIYTAKDLHDVVKDKDSEKAAEMLKKAYKKSIK